jgi:hypothetical protein
VTKSMMAAVVHEFGKPLAIEEVTVPTAGPGQILVKMAATGVCHTDLHAADGDWPFKPKPPFIPGHEGVGHVVAVGTDVRHVKEGDRVGVPWLYGIRSSATAMVYRDVSEAFWTVGDRARAVAVFNEGRAAGADKWLFMSSAARAADQQPTDQQSTDSH